MVFTGSPSLGPPNPSRRFAGVCVVVIAPEADAVFLSPGRRLAEVRIGVSAVVSSVGKRKYQWGILNLYTMDWFVKVGKA